MEDCHANGEELLMYSQFCYHIQQDEQKRRATMHINRKPGEQVEVEWAGDPTSIIDLDIGEIIKAYIFDDVMAYSQYAYVEAFLDMKQKSWISARIHMYEHYDIAIIPARVRAPSYQLAQNEDKNAIFENWCDFLNYFDRGIPQGS